MEKIVGDKLRKGAESHTTQDALSANQKFVGIYFGAHWAPPCRLFTKTLTDFYTKVNENGPQFEVVFVSVDGNNDAFERNFKDMPWFAVPYDDESRIQSLKQRYGINGIPTLVVLDREGALIGYDGRQNIQDHSESAFEVWEKLKTDKQ